MGMQITALQVTTGEELRTAQRIRERLPGVQPILPLRTIFEKRGESWREAHRVMLPGYVFVRSTAKTPETWHSMRRTDGVLRILGMLNDQDEARLMTLDNGGEPWGVSYARDCGGRIEPLDGPLALHWNWVTAIDRHRCRARIEMDVCGRKHKIDLTLVIQQAGS